MAWSAFCIVFPQTPEKDGACDGQDGPKQQNQ